MPTTPHRAAGWRIEPPVSVPSASIASPAATAAALPPELRCEAEVRRDVRIQALDALDVRGDHVRRGDRAKSKKPERLLDRQPREVVGQVSSWIDGTRKKPFTAAGALASASSCVSEGR